MKTNLLPQNDNLVIENLKADVGKSAIDLSHTVTFPVDIDGALYPICLVETVPSDSFKISVEVLLRQLQPLKVPLMTNFRVNTAFYYCDNRLAWKKWDRFMTGGRSGNEVYDVPRMVNLFIKKPSNPTKNCLADTSSPSGSFKITYKNSIHTYFGLSFGFNPPANAGYDDYPDHSDELPFAVPFFDYQMIKRDYYTNIDRLLQDPKSGNDFNNYDDIDSDWAYSNVFPVDDDEIRLIDGIQFKSGYNTDDDSSHSTETKGFILDKMRYHDVRPDYFTCQKKAPLRGTAPALTAESTLTLPSGTKLTITNDNGVIYEDWTQEGHGGGQKSYVGTDDGAPAGTDFNPLFTISGSKSVNLGANADHSDRKLYTDVRNLKAIEGETFGDLYLTGLLQANWTAADIRLLSQLTVWSELNMLHEPYYNDFLNAHFDNVRVGESPTEKPIYIGGTSQLISINEILQTSQTSQTSPLGQQAATAMSLANNFVGSYYCNNYGYIIGICYILPDLMYKPALPRHFSRKTKEDYYSPEFANLSMQATLNKEIFFSNDNDWNNGVWGYTGAFDELRSIPNRVAGSMLDSSKQDLQHWVLMRQMANDNLPSMSSNWLSLKGNVDPSAWAVPEEDKFMLQVANIITAVRPMPKVAIPKAL